ncbi:hypothetical protein DH86_00003605 [Scytalidium sp. 3C]|nr:hypothetical protein DH86_00003605 [Scytalidium sp. 3C]
MHSSISRLNIIPELILLTLLAGAVRADAQFSNGTIRNITTAANTTTIPPHCTTTSAGVLKPYSCYTYTETVSPTTCPTLHCPMQGPCPDLAAERFLLVPCRFDPHLDHSHCSDKALLTHLARIAVPLLPRAMSLWLVLVVLGVLYQPLPSPRLLDAHLLHHPLHLQ